jgi:acetyl esterase/lipase
VRRLLGALAAALLALLPACAPVDLLNDTISRQDLTVVHAIPYESGPLAGNPRLVLDVYRPADRPGPLPVVVFLYGGSWEFGRRQDYVFVAAELARRGVVVVVPDYRVYPEVRFPGFLQDAAQAVAFAYRSAPSWGGDPHRVFVVGHSAGAWLAAMLALDPHWLAADGLDRNRIAGTVGISGPYDFLPIVRPDIQRVFAPAESDLRVTQPIDFVDGRNRPMLLLQGLADTTVEPRNTTALDARIRAAGGPVRMRLYPGIGHVGAIAAFAPLFRTGPLDNGAPTLDDVTRFVTDPTLAAP